MKHKPISYLVAQEEERLLNEIVKLLEPTEGRTERLYFALGTLISAHLRCDPNWNYRERWIDDTIFFSVSMAPPDTVHVVGYINWGFCGQGKASNGIYEPLEAEFHLHRNGPDHYVDYDIKFCCEAITRHITPAGLEFAPYDSELLPRPNIEPFLAIFNGDRSQLANRTIHGKVVNQVGPETYLALTEIEGRNDVDERDRAIAALLLGKLGAPGRAHLITALTSGDTKLCLAALQGLEIEDADKPILKPHIEALMSHSDQRVRALATINFLDVAEEDDSDYDRLTGAIPELFWLLDKRQQKQLPGFAARLAIEALAWLAQTDDQLLDQLIDTLHHADSYRGAAAVLARLGARAEKALPTLAAHFHSEGELVSAAAGTLWDIGTDSAREIVLEGLAGNSEAARKAAIYVLTEKEPSPATAPALARLIFDNTIETRDRCRLVSALADISPRDEAIELALSRAVRPMMNCLNDDNYLTRRAAIEALGKIGPPAAVAAPALIGILLGKNYESDDDTISSLLEKNFSTNREILGQLDLAYQSNLRAEAAQALGNLKATAAIAALKQVLSEEGENMFSTLHNRAAAALAKLDTPGIEALLELLAEADNGRDYYDLESALEQAGAAAVPLLIKSLKDERISGFLLDILAHYGREAAAAVPDLIAMLCDSSPSIRAKAAECLRAIGAAAAAALPALTAALDDDDMEVRVRAAEAMEAIHHKDTENS